LKRFDVFIEAESTITVSADSEAEAVQEALANFSIHTVDHTRATVIHEEDED